jgi:hypothetical protein
MKLQIRWLVTVCMLSILPAVVAVGPVAARQTRATSIATFSVGMGKSGHMDEYLREYPRSRTAILSYLTLDTLDVDEVVKYLRWNASIQAHAGRDFWPQIALETRHVNLAEFRQEIARPGSRVNRSVHMLAREIASFRHARKWFFIRPFSEMNDGTLENPWEFANPQQHNTPQDLAASWKLLREAFDAEGATNAIFIFSPLAAYSVHHEQEVLTAMNLIPVGYIDAYGLNVYSRPLTAYGGKSPDPIPFAKLVQPWLDLLAHSKHHGIPLTVSEMAVSNQAADARRAAWVRDAFEFIRSHRYIMATYFNFPHRYWYIDHGTLAGQALQAEMDRY